MINKELNLKFLCNLENFRFCIKSTIVSGVKKGFN